MYQNLKRTCKERLFLLIKPYCFAMLSYPSPLLRTVPIIVTAHTSVHLVILGFPMGGGY